MSPSHCLIGYSQDTILGPDAIRRTLGVLQKDFPVQKISSVYKKYFSTKNEDLNSEIIFVYKTATLLSPEKALAKLKMIQNWTVKTDFVLLCMDQLVMLSPESQFPHPRLALDPAILRCASEVWGDFHHPVLDQSLNEAVKEIHSFEHIEFFSQGDAFL